MDKVRSLSFKVTIKAEDLEKASNPAMWPYRVTVRRFVNFRQKLDDEFAPHRNNMNGSSLDGVQPIGQPQTTTNINSHHQHANLVPPVVEPTPVANKFDVAGFREGVCH